MSKTSRMQRLYDVPLSYKETRGKRGVAVPYDECRRQIREQNLKGSISPNREASPNQDIEDYLAMGNSISARNHPSGANDDSRITPYL